MGPNVSNVMRPMTFKGKHFNLDAPLKHPFVMTTPKKQHYVFQLMKTQRKSFKDHVKPTSQIKVEELPHQPLSPNTIPM
jgi:hypothetical protein